MRKLFYSILFLAFLNIGCSQLIPSNPPTPPGTPDIVCHVRYVIITKNNKSNWTNIMIDLRTKFLHAGYQYFKMDFDVLPTEILEKPEWFDVADESQFGPMRAESRNRSENKKELTVWLINTLKYNGTTYGGLSFYPSNQIDFAHGIFISSNSFSNVFAHEIGHAFNLLHYAPDDPYAYCATEPCNDMTYCTPPINPYGSCYTHTFNDTQVTEIRKWALLPPRINVVTYSGPPRLPHGRTVYQGKEPATCQPK